MFNSLSPISLSTFSQFNFSAMANTNRSSHPYCPLTIDTYARALEKISSPILTPKTEIGVTYGDVNVTSMLNTRNQPLADRAEKNIFSNHEIDDSHDGRIHSVPYIKNGPYTCPKCNEQFVTSQSFAAHATSSHYKYESKDQRRKRLMKRVRMRNLNLQKVSGGLTLVPVSSETARTANVVEQGGQGLANATRTNYVSDGLTFIPVSSEAARTANVVEQGWQGLANATGTNYVSGGLTFVPVSSEAPRTAKVVEQGGKGLANATGTSYVARVAYQDGGGLTKRVKVEGDLQSHYQVSPLGMEARGVGSTGVKIKSERYA